MKRILIAEDHTLTMLGTKQVLATHFGDARIFTTENFDETLELLDRQDIDFLLLDIDMPGGAKLNMIESIRLKQPGILILVFSGQDEQIYALPFLRAGADGFISKRADLKEFINAVESVLQHRKYLSPAMLQENIRLMTHSDSNNVRPLQLLSQREIEVAQLLVKGDSSTEISKKLYLSVSAISIYKSRIFQKLGLKNIMELSSFLKVN